MLKTIMKLIPTSLKKIYYGSKTYQKKLERIWALNLKNHNIKKETILFFKKKYNINTLVETGTYLGEMVFYQKQFFSKIYTIELSRTLHSFVKKRLRHYLNIEFLQGDSGEILNKIVPNLKEPSIFWLDAHYSGGITAKGNSDTPVIKEIETIFQSDYNHIVLIDDARCFGNEEYPDYPSLELIEKIISKLNSNYKLENVSDIIRVYPDIN